MGLDVGAVRKTKRGMSSKIEAPYHSFRGERGKAGKGKAEASREALKFVRSHWKCGRELLQF